VKALSVGHQPDEVARILTQSPTVQAFPDKQQQIEYIERTYKQAYEGFKQLKADLSRTNTLKGLER
jgi:enterochelin esterase-like enzyme